MNRRTFIQTAGAAGLGLAGRVGWSTAAPVAQMLELLEESPRERIPGELVRMIRAGLRQEEAIAALSLAAVRNVQPYPDVGYKYHAFMMLRAIQSAAQHLSSTDQWLPVVWAADYFKNTQAEEHATSGWRLPARVAGPVDDAQAARHSLIAALDHWDRDAADAAVVNYAQIASAHEILSLLFEFGARDLRAIGHKAITVSNAHRLCTLFGGDGALPLLRSTVAALQNKGGDPDPASHDLSPDRPLRRNREKLHEIPRSWKQGRDDTGARSELRAALNRATEVEAGPIVVEMLRQQISPEAIWQVLFDMAAELPMRQASIVLLHASTSANALHYAYRTSSDEQTQQLMLLQCAAFCAMFRQFGNASDSNPGLEELQPLPLGGTGAEAIREIFSELAADRRAQAARKTLGYLRAHGDADALIATARQHLAYGGDEAHDYKWSEAVFDSYSQFSNFDWRCRYLSAGMAYFKAPAKPIPIVEETLELMRS